MSLTVKAYLVKKGEEKREIRRFAVPADVSSSFSYLQKKVADIYPTLKQGNFNLYWTGMLILIILKLFTLFTKAICILVHLYIT